ncbi:MAG: inositol oxygenase family protein [Blastocatellia bacterium]
MGHVAAQPFLEQLTDQEKFRNYEAEARSSVKDLYRANHTQQTLDFVLAKKEQYGRLDDAEMGVWEVIEALNEFVDDSDPDTSLPQIVHALQTAEAIRMDGHPRWFILAGLIHDTGKMLSIFGEPQWAVVGDTFPVGCQFSEKIVYPEFFAENPDSRHPVYSTPNGIYEPHCGLDNVHFSWGHDEYLYLVTRDYLPKEALWMLRYHSAYPVHQAGAYTHLLGPEDAEILKWVKAFNPYDLYSKRETEPDVKALKPFYEELIAEYFPAKLRW